MCQGDGVFSEAESRVRSVGGWRTTPRRKKGVATTAAHGRHSTSSCDPRVAYSSSAPLAARQDIGRAAREVRVSWFRPTVSAKLL